MVLDVSTDSKLTYKYFPSHTQAVRLGIQAKRDAIIAITDNPDLQHPPYVIKIGGKYNTRNTIEKNGRVVAELDNAPKLNGNTFINFWITWFNHVIKFGQESTTTPLFEFKDNNLQGAFFGVATEGVPGIWKIDDRWNGWPSDTTETVEWVEDSDGHVPKDAVIGGYDGLTGLYYVGRVKIGLEYFPGKVHSNARELEYVGPNLTPAKSRQYDVLCGGLTSWVLARSGDVPPRAILPC